MHFAPKKPSEQVRSLFSNSSQQLSDLLAPKVAGFHRTRAWGLTDIRGGSLTFTDGARRLDRGAPTSVRLGRCAKRSPSAIKMSAMVQSMYPPSESDSESEVALTDDEALPQPVAVVSPLPRAGSTLSQIEK